MTLVTYSDPFHSRASFDKKIFAQKSNEIGHKTALIKEASSIYDIHVKALFGNTGTYQVSRKIIFLTTRNVVGAVLRTGKLFSWAWDIIEIMVKSTRIDKNRQELTRKSKN